ncbi:unnamed protein product, partial [Closterium sp. NIES-53]
MSGVDILDLDYDAILAAMYALSVSAEGDCYLCMPPDPGIEAAALCACESALPRTAPAKALHTFMLDSAASRCLFRDSTTLTPLSAPVPVSLANPLRGPVLARSSTVLLCPAVPSGSLSGLHLHSFSTNLVSASGSVAPPSSCRLLSHQTLLWHHRLGHPSLPRLRGMHSFPHIFSLPRFLPPLPPSPAPPCLPCVEGRQHAAPHSSSFSPTIVPLQTLHMDVWGPARVSGQGRECYFLQVVDDYMHNTTVFRLRSKGQVVAVMIPWIHAIRLQLRERLHENLPVLRLHSDRGGEFSSDLLRDFCRGEGILQAFTLPASPQKNRIAERRIGLVMEVAPQPLATCLLAGDLAYTALEGRVGDASVFRVWGSRAFVRDTSVDKLSACAITCVFLGFPPNAPGWQFYHPTSRRVFPSQDVTFDESDPFYRLFPYHSAPPPPPPLFLAPGPPPVDPLPPQGGGGFVTPPAPPPTPSPIAAAAAEGACFALFVVLIIPHFDYGVHSFLLISFSILTARSVVSGGAELGGAEPEGAGSRGAEPAGVEPGGAELAGVVPGGAELEGVESGGAESEGSDSGDAAPLGIASSGGPAGASPRLSPRPEPLSPQQLREWFSQRTCLRSGAVGAGDSVAGHTGAGGAEFLLDLGVDNFHTFSPTLKMTSLRGLLLVAAQRDYELHSLEFSTAFLQGSLHEEIWLRRPPGFTGTTLAALGFTPSTADPSLFLCTDTSLPPFYVLVYVDDLIFATAETEALSLVKSERQKRHTCTDLGELRSYLGLQTTRDRAQRTITLTQSHMVQQVLQRFSFHFSSPQPTPLSTGHSLSAPPSDKSVEPSGPYPELVGCLMYLMTCTRPDLAYPLSILARYVAPAVVTGLHLQPRSTRSSSVLSSSCEAEIYAGAMAAQELRWLTYLLTDLGEQPRLPPVL